MEDASSFGSFEIPQEIFWGTLPLEIRLEILKKTNFAAIQSCKLVDKTTYRLIEGNREFLSKRKISIKIRNVTRRSVLLKSSSKERDEAHLKRHEIFSQHQAQNKLKRRRSTDSEDFNAKKCRLSDDAIIFPSISTFPSTSSKEASKFNTDDDATLPPALMERLLGIVQNCEIDKLKFDEASLTDNDLVKLSTLLKNQRIKRIDFVLCNFEKITAHTFHEFLKLLKPSLINISLINHCENRGFFGSDFIAFLISRKAFGLYDVPVRLDLTDEILLSPSLKCDNFRIGDTHKLTIHGIKQFIEKIRNGIVTVENVVIDVDHSLKSAIIENFPNYDKRKPTNSINLNDSIKMIVKTSGVSQSYIKFLRK